MKKILSVALSLMLALSLLCAGAFAGTIDFTGVWYTSIYGIETVFTLNDDGSYALSFSAMGETEEDEGTWEAAADGILLDKGTADEMVLTYDAQSGSMSGMVGDMELVFTRESAAFALPAALTDAAPEEFEGQWAAGLICIAEASVAPQDFGFELSMDVQKDLNCFTMTIDGAGFTLNVVPGFADGAMILNLDMADGSASYAIVCQLLEDGSMSASFPAEAFGQEAVFVLEKAEA